MLTPSVGGVCTLLNETCCTYIPDETNDEDGHRVSNAICQLNEIKRDLQQDVHPGRGSLFSWLTSGPWWQLFLKIMTPVIAVLLLFCLFYSVCCSLYQTSDIKDGWRNCWYNVVPGLPASRQEPRL
ncbi:hypothetical protein AMECASPLE_025121 [Ameca splendens]|uniref:Uncharacterized protein n=1 Tax=Ameca splendens TaxID=208324 RepID=A0ABV0Z4J0_9TELE